MIDCYIVVVDVNGVILIGYVVLELLEGIYISLYLVVEIDCFFDEFMCILCVMCENDVFGLF